MMRTSAAQLFSFSLMIAIVAVSCQHHYTIRLHLEMDRAANVLLQSHPQDADILLKDYLLRVNKVLRTINLHIQVVGYTISKREPQAPTFGSFFTKKFEEITNASSRSYGFYQFWTAKLFTKWPQSEITVLGAMCSSNALGLVSLVTFRDRSVDYTRTKDDNEFLHDVLLSFGKSMGMTHEKCRCFDPSVCIMNPDSERSIGSFGTCDENWIQNEITSGNKLLCLNRMPNGSQSKISLCGNGIQEMGEDCDCYGDDAECNRCCHTECMRKVSPGCSSPSPSVPPVVTPAPTAKPVATTPSPTTTTRRPTPSAATTSTKASTQDVPKTTEAPATTASTTSTTAPPAKQDSSLVIGIVVSVVIVLLLIAIVATVVIARRKRARKSHSKSGRKKRKSGKSRSRLSSLAKSKPDLHVASNDMGPTSQFFAPTHLGVKKSFSLKSK